jgi:hypothetical protein
MTSLYDADILLAALGTACKEPARIVPLLKANGDEPIDFGEIRLLHGLSRHLAELHSTGVPFHAEIAASRVTELSGCERKDAVALIADALGRANPPAFDLFLDRLTARRFRRRLSEVGARAANGCPDSELVEAAGLALREFESAAVKPRTLVPLRFTDYTPDVPPPIAFGASVGDAPIAAGDLAMFAGESGAGKSLSTLDLAIAWTTRGDWLGFPCAVESGRAVVITSDGDGADPVRTRVCRLGAGRGLDPAALDSLPLKVIPADGFTLDNPAAFAALLELLAEFNPDLVALETLSSLAGSNRDTNSQADVTDFIVRRLRPLQLRPDGSRRTLGIGHHLRKRASAPGANRLRDRVAGSFYTVAGVDACIGFEPSGERGFTVRVVKPSRWGIRFRPFHVRIDGDPPGPLKLINTGPLEQTAGEQADDENAVLEALSTLSGFGPDGWSKVADLKRRIGVPDGDKGRAKRIERAVKRLSESGKVEAHERRRGLVRLAQTPNSNPRDVEP